MSNKPTQLDMFSKGEDLPLFSGTAQPVQPDTFQPQAPILPEIQDVLPLEIEQPDPPMTEKQRKAEAYEAKRQARIARLNMGAARASQEAEANYRQAKRMAEVIPFGQPILVGHHSEAADRRYRERISNKWEKAHDLHEKAGELASRAEAAARNDTIFSDDPLADEKLEAKIARLSERQEMMKAANKLVRKGDRAGLAEMGFSETVIDKLFTPDFAGRLGFPDYEITNNGANIRRLKERLVVIQRNAERVHEETETESGIRIVDNPDENRLQVFFPGKPAASVRDQLKAHGFRWAHNAGCWQRHLSADARYWAEQITKEL